MPYRGEAAAFRSAFGIACLTFGLLSVLATHAAHAAQYSVADETQLRRAFADAAASTDPSFTIILTADITLSDPTPLAAPSKPLSIETGSFTLRGANAAIGNGNSLAFQGGALTINGALTGGDGLSAGGGSGLILTGGSAINTGTITSGASIPQGTGTDAVVLNSATLQNQGTIAIRNANDILRLNAGSKLVNEGIIQASIITSSNTTIVNDGVMEGLISFNGGNNTMELHAGSNITTTGTRVVTSNGANDALVLGGVANGTFDISQIGGSFPVAAQKYMNFDVFTKKGSSTWTLTGQTPYRTPWQLLEGTLSISSDANLGGTLSGPTGTLTFDGGALRNTAAFSSARNVTINNGGGTFDTQSDLIWSGTIAGGGRLTKTGASTLTLTGTNTYSGGTTISDGTLRIGNGGTTGSIAGDVVNNATLVFNRSDDLVFPGQISGSGAVILATASRITFTADNTYTGLTTISGGTLQLGNGGASGSIAGDVLNNGVLAFNRVGLTTSPGTISGPGRLEQNGTGTTVIDGDAAHTGGTVINAGTLQIGDGGTRGSIQGAVQNNATLSFNRADTLVFNGVVSGNGVIRQIGSGITQFTGDSSGYTGSTTVENGVLSVNGKLCGAMGVGGAGTLRGVGTVCGTTNSGIVAPGNSIGTLTINGNYVGNGGTLQTEAVLGGDNSPADRLVVTGNTGGNTQVRVINQGGTGAPTAQGIKIVDVGGVSAGNFTLIGDYSIAGQPAVVAGAYAYTLQKNGVTTPNDGDWYLRSSLAPSTPPVTPPETLPETPTGPGAPATPPPSAPSGPIYQPGVPVYEAYPSMLQMLNALPTWRQRTGGRYWATGADSTTGDALSNEGSLSGNALSNGGSPSGNPLANGGSPSGNSLNNESPDSVSFAPSAYRQGAWARIEGQQGRLRPGNSTTDTSTDFDLWKMQVGIDRSVAENTAGRLVAGLNAQYANLSSTIDSRYGRGDIDTGAYGIGATLTWYGNNGVYVDGQAQLNWFDSTLSSRTLSRALDHGNSGKGYALGVETGKRIGISNGWGITPQAQLVYSAVDFSTFDDPYGARVSMDKGDSLAGRLGVTADYQRETSNGAGKTDSRLDLYGSANFYYEFLDGTAVNVSDTRISSSTGHAEMGVAAGASYAWTKDKYAVYGELSARTGMDDPGRSYSYTGTVGVRVRF